MSLISCFIYFNPRSPHGERLLWSARSSSSRSFQSTLPARGATCVSPFESRSASNFNPRSPHGERPANITDADLLLLFQSTLPARGATTRVTRFVRTVPISIHAPRTGSDTQAIGSKLLQVHFNPRSPHGERHQRRPVPVRGRHFNPRSPHGERHDGCARYWVQLPISTHAPRTGSDLLHQ